MDKITEAEIAPAYGKVYRKWTEAEKAFRDGKDFKMLTVGHRGTYCSIRDFAAGAPVTIYFGATLDQAVCVTV